MSLLIKEIKLLISELIDGTTTILKLVEQLWTSTFNTIDYHKFWFHFHSCFRSNIK